jgi:aryl-alcohol dehydrogenase-like predicted oxidoreductase
MLFSGSKSGISSASIHNAGVSNQERDQSCAKSRISRPWSPLGRGVLTAKDRFGTPVDSRAASKYFSSFIQEHLTEDKARIVDALVTAAEGIGRTPVETAIAWLRDRPGVGSVILGARNLAQLKILLSSDNLVLPEELNNALSDVSAPHSSYPESGWAQLPKDRGN